MNKNPILIVMDLKDKVVVITGSSSGIGKAIALRFAGEGSKIVTNYSTNRDGGEETLSEIKKRGGTAILVQADVSKQKDVQKLFKSIVEAFGTVDILINNAGISSEGPFLESSQIDFERIIETNLVGTMLCSQEAISIMEKKGGGKILNTSSVRGAEYGGRALAYAASKAGINSFTKTLAKQVAPKIHVNAVGPGFVYTRPYDKLPQKQKDDYISSTYLKRWITVEEIADAFVFLAKNDAITSISL